MAYTPLPAKADGDYFTLGNYNTVKGNFDASAPAVFAAKGDLYGGSSSQAGARLAVGADDATLVADSSQTTGLAWQIQPGARVYASAEQEIAVNTWVALEFDSESHDPNAMHSTATNTSRLTVPTGGAGLYLLGAAVDLAGLADDPRDRTLRLCVGGSTTVALARLKPGAGSDAAYLNVSTVYALNPGDYVEAQVYFAAGVAGPTATVVSANCAPVLWAQWLRRQ